MVAHAADLFLGEKSEDKNCDATFVAAVAVGG